MTKRSASNLVDVRVIKQLPMGLLVELPDGRRGIIRAREIVTDGNDTLDWRKNYPVGWKGCALLLPSSTAHSVELSLRLVKKDFWTEFVEKIDKQKIFDGIVVGVVTYGTFVELAPGVTGLLHRSCLPVWVKNEPLDLFWPGDRVRVQVRNVDLIQRRIGLEIAPSWLETSATARTRDLSTLSHQPELSELLRGDVLRRHVLLVEDRLDQRMMVSNWLQRVGQRVDVVESSQAALNYLEKSRPEIAIIDVGLPGDMDGIALAHHILNQWPQVRVINATDWAHADERSAELDELRARGSELIEKPLLPEDLIRILKAQPLAVISNNQPQIQPVPLPDAPGERANINIRALVRECRVTLGFELCLLFSVDPAQRVVTIIEQAGTAGINKHAVASLVFSPVRDVAEDQKTLCQNEITLQDKDYFRYLLELYPQLASCIGTPIPGQLPVRYALFVMDKSPRAITREQELYARAIALALGSALEQKIFQERAILMQRTALIGQLTKSMVHEINNLIGPMASRLDYLKTTVLKNQKNSTSTEVQERQKRIIANEIDGLHVQAHNLIGITRMFGRITAKARDEVIRMDQIVQEVINLLKEPGTRAHVNLFFVPPDDMPIVRSQSAALQQVVLNLVLNAIQQIQELRPEHGGCVCVHIETPEKIDENHSFRVLVEDNGPGIHVSLWGKIFEIGFSTRSEGSGIGLYISRSLVEQMGGKIYVEESYILGGTKFVLEIPANFH